MDKVVVVMGVRWWKKDGGETTNIYMSGYGGVIRGGMIWQG